MEAQIEQLEQRLSKIILFSKDEIKSASQRLNAALIGKFFGRGFPIDYVEKEMWICWNLQGEFHISAMSKGLMLFQCPSKEAKNQILAKGPWSLARQLLALEPWGPKFRSGRDTINQLRVWFHLPDLPLELWEECKILKIASQVGVPMFLSEWTLNSSRLGYAWVCVLLDALRPICPRVRIMIHDDVMWQQFSYEELSNIYYNCGHIGVTLMPATVHP
ncbi:uncharacterized protein [Elaeis guineensis]|uniref:Uncharacterized protein LOC105035800 n=1 Tax=Elaeis guineensis var. tenera TaxID=51953 RepID=A0A6I9QHS8_ELAGV|nr:uncharacterized protein LOC105035800 [Elaeis guineensis]